MRLFSPAKINLFFRVLGKRSDGFHEIASLFQAISLGDTLTIFHGEGRDTLICDDPQIPTDSTNLILKAAELFRKKTGCTDTFSFSLEKRIPVEAGLGGGSSNAASTLWGLNQLLKLEIEDQTLAQWGEELGADIPFFFSPGCGYCEGKGEKVSPYLSTAPPSVTIVKPSENLSTKEVFSSLSCSQLQYWEAKPDLPLSEWKNDLEKSAFSLLPKLAHLKSALHSAGFSHVQMTGSGSAFICFGETKKPLPENVTLFPSQFHFRSEGSWYKFP